MGLQRWLASGITTIGILVGSLQIVDAGFCHSRLKQASTNGEFLVVFTPAPGKSVFEPRNVVFPPPGKFFDPYTGRLAGPEERRMTPLLEVFRGDESDEPIWTTTPKQTISAESSIFVSDDGRFVVTFDPKKSASTLDSVLTFYRQQGEIRQFSPHQLLEMNYKECARKFLSAGRLTTFWCWPMVSFLASIDGRDCFCLWLGRDDRWLAWTLDDAQRFELNEDMIAECNRQGRSLSLEALASNDEETVFRYFIASRRIPEDRKLFDDLLNKRVLSTDRWDVYESTNSLPCRVVGSQQRWLADTLLAIWDKKIAIAEVSDQRENLPFAEIRYRLGLISGRIQLPVTPTSKDGPLWIFLVPATIAETDWTTANFERLFRLKYEGRINDYGRVEEFLALDLLPGDYWIKAIWDKAAPFAEAEAKTPVPDMGDFESVGRQMITIRAGNRTGAVVVDCKTEVAAP